MTKEMIIKCAASVGDKLGILKANLFTERESRDKIGNNQFRELASICRNADCYEEIELLINYNTAKADGGSWANLIEYSTTINHSVKKKFGNIIVDQMKIIKTQSENDGDSVLENLSLFFGYMYWNARIWSKGDNR